MQAYIIYFATPVIYSLKMLKALAHFVICFLRENDLAYSDAASSEEEKKPQPWYKAEDLCQRIEAFAQKVSISQTFYTHNLQLQQNELVHL